MKLPGDRLTIASRGSKLALWQANHVADRIRKHGVAVEIQVIKTTGDRVQDRFLHEIGGKGLFVREIEDALAAGSADIAVHSLKDLPAIVPEGFTLAAILKRHSPADALIFPKNVTSVPEIPPDGSNLRDLKLDTIGTASLRRAALLARFAPQVNVVGLRGNVDTRIEKLNAGQFDAILLAEASLERLGWQDLPYVALSPKWFVPCAAQGALTIESRAESPWREAMTSWFDDPSTRRAVEVERTLLAGVGGDCTMPFGAIYEEDQQQGRLTVGVYSEQGPFAEVSLSDLALTSSISDIVGEAMPQLHAAGLCDVLEVLKLKLPQDFATTWL